MPRRIWIVLLAGVLGLGIVSIARAQMPDDWTAPYRPAMLPQYADEMAVHADAPRYTIDMALAVTDKTAMIGGHQRVTYTNRLPVPLDSLVFRLFPNLPSYGATMSVSRILAAETPVDPALDESGSVLTVRLPAPLNRGEQVTVEMDFAITVTAGVAGLYAQFSYLDGILALPNAYPVLSVYEPGAGWWTITEQPQGDAVYSETAFYTVTLTAPDDLIIAASGSAVDLVTNGDGTLTHRYVAPLMRDFAVFASAAYVAVSGEQDGVQITMYYDPATPDALATARTGLSMTQNAVRIYNTVYGPYPFAELDVVETPTTAGGIEYPGVFVVASNVWDQTNDFFEFVIAHEAAHQWWYSLVGNDQTTDPWIDEALAQYSVALYIRDLEGDAAYHAALESFRLQYEQFLALVQPGTLDQRIGLPVTEYRGQAYFYMVYQKGPLFYAALDDTFGTNRVIQALQGVFAAYRYGIVEPSDLLNSFETAFGADLDDLFIEWVGDVAAVG